jgi:hypothetical protein
MLHNENAQQISFLHFESYIFFFEHILFTYFLRYIFLRFMNFLILKQLITNSNNLKIVNSLFLEKILFLNHIHR